METSNRTVTKFILMGFSLGHQGELLLAVVFLAMYITSLAGNILIFCLVLGNTQLHTPMYFFLSNFSILDIIFTSVISPQLLWNLFSGDKSISFPACIAQLYFYFLLGTVEFFLLTSMSYDRYAAICRPLHYHTIMSGGVCVKIVLACWFGGFLSVLCPIIQISKLSFCKSNRINHFFCDTVPLLELSCTSTHFIKLMDFMLSSLVIVGSATLTLISYVYIISTILHIPTTSSRMKAFNTCATHLTLVSLSCGISIFTYVIPSRKETLEAHKVPAILTTMVFPLLNPFLFTLKNDSVKEVLRRTIQRIGNMIMENILAALKENKILKGKVCKKTLLDKTVVEIPVRLNIPSCLHYSPLRLFLCSPSNKLGGLKDNKRTQGHEYLPERMQRDGFLLEFSFLVDGEVQIETETSEEQIFTVTSNR
ncbi:olfactory receptor 6J1-like [Paroedura picta]|uniref:olfactory receptor 6J1-like n=1 Tax=Paroedura picta TaxID=143630 RepID=UPI004055E578